MSGVGYVGNACWCPRFAGLTCLTAHVCGCQPVHSSLIVFDPLCRDLSLSNCSLSLILSPSQFVLSFAPSFRVTGCGHIDINRISGYLPGKIVFYLMQVRQLQRFFPGRRWTSRVNTGGSDRHSVPQAQRGCMCLFKH